MNRKKLFFAGAVGNCIEVFEAIVYAFLQPFIVSTFFPPSYRENKVLFFITIILPFLARPLGALCFGLIGDLKGRKTVLELTMFISGISCCFMAAVPAFSQAGYFSFFLILLFRFLFGIAMSGEYNNSFLYLAEHAAPKNRGYILSWAAFGINFGVCIASAIAFGFTHLAEAHIVPEWTFRILFLFSALTLYIGYKTRKELSETVEFFMSYPAFEENKPKAIYKTARSEIRKSWLNAFKIILLSGFGTHITYSIYLYGPFHLEQYNIHGLNFKETTLLATLASGIAAFIIPFVGRLCDRIGRDFLLMFSVTTSTALYLAFFFGIDRMATYHELMAFYGAFGLLSGIFFCAGPAEIINLLPNKMRSTINGLLYSVPAIIFGALSLPYFQSQIGNHPDLPLLILVIAAPLVVFYGLMRKGLEDSLAGVSYSLENVKVH